MKLHLCAGDIYLGGFINCDVSGIVLDEPIEGTTLDHYYDNRKIGFPKTVYIDKRMDLTSFPWDFEDESISEIVMIQAIEHFDSLMARKIVCDIYRILIPGGKLLIDFPDIQETVNQYMQSHPKYCMRLIYGSQRNGYSKHVNGFTKETFSEFMGGGWDLTFREIVEHEYPAIGCEAVKK